MGKEEAVERGGAKYIYFPTCISEVLTSVVLVVVMLLERMAL